MLIYKKAAKTNQAMIKLGNMVTVIEREKKNVVAFAIGRFLAVTNKEGLVIPERIALRVIYDINDFGVIDTDMAIDMFRKYRLFIKSATETNFDVDSLNGIFGIEPNFGKGILDDVEKHLDLYKNITLNLLTTPFGIREDA